MTAMTVKTRKLVVKSEWNSFASASVSPEMGTDRLVMSDMCGPPVGITAQLPRGRDRHDDHRQGH
jgi:hypothetical protein